MRPTLLSSCALATTAAEARFRIDGRPQPPRAALVVALDAGAAVIVERLAARDWQGARFLRYEPDHADGARRDLADVVLTSADGDVPLSEQLPSTDFMMMIATVDDGAEAATAIGNACTLHGIMTAGLVFANGGDANAAVSALRPHARVLLVSHDEEDAAEVLSAVGA
ncbi:MAG TPA: hypothetical protein VH373_06320 [Jatrophihabitantaceae bacterium]